MEIITSKQNPAVIAAAKLADKKYREMTRTFCFRGSEVTLRGRFGGCPIDPRICDGGGL